MYEENEDFFLHELPNKKLQTKTSKLLPMLNLQCRIFIFDFEIRYQ